MSSSLPKISIITPSYNQGKFLEQTILSVINQNYPNLEYIIMDGGSSDDSVEIIKKHLNKITYWESKRDNGQADAINKGLSKCTGDIICWINSDDVLMDGALENIAQKFKNINEPAIVSGNFRTIDVNGNVIWQPKSENDSLYASNYSALDLLKCWRNTLPQPSTFWNRAAFEKLRLLNANYHFAMDLEYWLRAISMGIKIYKTNSVYSSFRVHPKSKSSTLEVKLKEELKSLQKTYLRTKAEKFFYTISFFIWFSSESKINKAIGLVNNGNIRGSLLEITKSIVYFPMNIIFKARNYFYYFKLLAKFTLNLNK